MSWLMSASATTDQGYLASLLLSSDNNITQSSFFTYWGKALTIPSIIWFSTWSTALIIFFKIISSFKEIIYHWDYVPITTLILISIISLLHKSVNWFYAFLKIFWITIHKRKFFFCELYIIMIMSNLICSQTSVFGKIQNHDFHILPIPKQAEI